MKGKELQKYSKAQNTFNRIVRWNNECDITLTAEEEHIYRRWNTAHKLFLQKKFTTEQIAEKIKDLHSVSIFTARNDIYQAQALFEGSIKSNKKYLLHHHAENILMQIERFKLDPSLVHMLPKLMDAYTKAVMAMPDEINKDVMPPPQINFTPKGNNGPAPKDFEDAVNRMKQRIESDITDIPHEDVDK